MPLRIARTGLALGLALGILAAVFAFLWLNDLNVFTIDNSRIELIVHARQADNSLVFDRNGRKIGEFFNSYHVYVPYAKLPKNMVNAIVAIEDHNFWSHHGFDPKGILRAALMRLTGKGVVQGASTLTQQVVRHFLLPSERTVQRKVQEIALAIQVEKRLPKSKILEIYANSLFLGNGSYGVGAAAYRYFGKSVSQLDTAEAALIAGLFQSPSRYNPVRYPKRAKRRQIQVLKAMYHEKMISFARAKKLMRERLVYKEYRPTNTSVAPYFVDYVKEQAQKLLAAAKAPVDGQGLRIYTTLDALLQRAAEQAVADSSPLLDHAQENAAMVKGPHGRLVASTLEAALLAVDPTSGEILAMVGGRNYAKSKFNRTWQAQRSPGSAFKPVVYSLALSKNWKWSDVIYVSPINIDNYRPRTPEKDFLTETTLFRAFYRSMNTPTIELGQQLGLTPVLDQARRLGIRTPIKEEFGSMLGSSDTTMMDLARMYATFADAGRQVEQVAITRITNRTGKVLYQAQPAAQRSTQAISPQIAFLTTEGMRAVLRRGTGYTAAHLANVAVGKTGTSNQSTDNWFCGFAPNLAAVVWVGTDEHAPIRGDATGGKLALPIWDKFMTRAFQVRPPTPFRAPSGITTAVVNPNFGGRTADGVRMYFLKGNEPEAEAASASAALEALSEGDGGNYRDVFAH